MSKSSSVLVAGLVASAFWLGACTSSQQFGGKTSGNGDGYARRTGVLATAWGDLPTYQVELRQLPVHRAPPPRGLNGTVTMDLLVDRDGSVKEMAIVQSSGDARIDHTVQSEFVGARFATKIAPGDPAPYAFRVTRTFHDDGKEPIASNEYSFAPTYAK